MKSNVVYLCLISCLIILTSGQAAYAAWIPDGVEVAHYPTPDPDEPGIAPDGAGGSIIVWQDSRNGNLDIYAQRTDSIGTVLWTIDGVPICIATGSQLYTQIISDGTGGAFVTWQDNRGETDNDDIYIQRIDASGTVLWAENGVPLCTATENQVVPQITSDGAGGAIVAWSDFRSGYYSDLYAQRIDVSGTVQWTTDGVPVCTVTGHKVYPQITSDGAGGAIVTWQDNRSDNYDIYAQRINATGTIQWTTDGVPLCTATRNQVNPRITPDNTGGAIVTWVDNRSDNYDIYAQRVNASGTVQWTIDGVPVCTLTSHQTHPRITFDESGGAIVTWEDSRSGNNHDIYAQRIDASGTVQWIIDGAPICTEPGSQSSPQITSDGAGGAIMTWYDSRGSSYDIYVQQISASGKFRWTIDGVPVCTALGAQYKPLITPDSSGGAIVTWYDYRDGIDWIDPDIYAQRIDVSGAGRWTTDGVPVCTATGVQEAQQITSDGAGGSIVMWRDCRGSDVDIYAQRVDALGNILWLTNGVPLCTATEDQEDPQITSDGAGGAIVTWSDSRGGYWNIYAQRIDASGTVQWTTDGVLLCTAANSQYYPQITSDSAGGAIVTWTDYRSASNEDIYIQRIDASGTIQWAADGVPVCVATGDQTGSRVISDGAGGAIVTWVDLRSGSYNIYVQRIDASGTIQWIADGTPLCTALGGQTSPQVTSDGTGGAIVTWVDFRSGSYDIYVQRIDASGTVQWITNGVPLCTATEHQTCPQITFDESGGAIVTWQDDRSGDDDIYAQRIDASGTVQWTTDGVPLCTATLNQLEAQITPDGFGGAIVTWQDDRSGNYDTYAQRIDASGVVQWTVDGVPICTETGEQLSPQIVSDGAGGALVTWVDERSGESRIYIQRTTDIGMGPLCEIYPEIIVIPDSIQTGTFFNTSFTITNIGMGTLVGSVEESCNNFDVVSGAGSFGLLNGESHVVSVRFEPTEAGTHQCDIETGMYLCCDVSVTGTAYSCPSGPVLYVDVDAVGSNDGTSWADACTTLYDALDRSDLCDNVTEIWVADGTYYPTGGTDRYETFQLRDGLAIYGGFGGTESALSERDLFVNSSVLSGDIGVAGDDSDNSHHVVSGIEIGSMSILDGFTITGGNAEDIFSAGGGMFTELASPTLRNIIFRDNRAQTKGGGMYNSEECYPSLYNVVFYNNTAGDFGGGIYNYESSPVLVNVTFNSNRAGDSGAAMFNELNSSPPLTNAIMWNDSTDSMVLPEIANHNGSNPVISYSIVMDCGIAIGGEWETAYGIDGGNNIDYTPRFINASGGDLRLFYRSRAIDAGNASVPGLPATDLDGNPRIQGATIDMGAYEGQFYIVEATITTDPANLDIILDGETLTAPSIFMTRSGEIYEIGTITPQVQGEMHYSFTGWSDAGDTIHTVTIPEDPIIYTASFSWAYLYAAIDSIVDVPGDQGGWARVYFRRSHYDNLSETVYPIERYDMHRRIDDVGLAAAVLEKGEAVTREVNVQLPDGSEALLSPFGDGTKSRYISYGDRYYLAIEDAGSRDLLLAPPGLWEVLGNVSAMQQDSYVYLAPTLADSAETLVYTAFYISAHTTTPAVFFESPADSGYSVDNIAPGVPLGLAVAYNTGGGNELTWDPAPEPDFQYYRVYRGTDPEFIPVPGTEVHSTATPQWTDPDNHGSGVYYKVTALDHAGNESGPGSAVTTTGTEGSAVPKAFALGQNVPNPFNPSTTVYYDVPDGGGNVSIRIFDVSGRLVRTLVDGHQAAGSQSVTWSGVNDRGQSAASGIYFYRMTALEFTRTRKMVLLR